MKKFKLFTTIASLCLAVALMAFGVYAASITDLSVSGTISFGATEIDGQWSKVTVTLSNGEFEDKLTTKTIDSGLTGDVAVGNITVKDINEEMTITVEVEFTNKSNAVAAQITANKGTLATGDGYTLTAEETAGSAAANQGDVVAAKVVYTFKVTDKAQSVSNIAWKATFNAAPVNA